MSHGHSHNSHGHGHSHGNSSWTSNWGQAPTVESAEFRGNEIPSHVAVQLKLMVAQLKVLSYKVHELLL